MACARAASAAERDVPLPAVSGTSWAATRTAAARAASPSAMYTKAPPGDPAGGTDGKGRGCRGPVRQGRSGAQTGGHGAAGGADGGGRDGREARGADGGGRGRPEKEEPRRGERP
ncbi:hypothetical protein GCM10010517_41690 [Streptosporangium fragile]|uniref:Uncharacterized protein n=1 Tax=Streptosporangium fragile TaxID=46186 RepID=A0ABN3VZN3_9ACTN